MSFNNTIGLWNDLKHISFVQIFAIQLISSQLLLVPGLITPLFHSKSVANKALFTFTFDSEVKLTSDPFKRLLE